LAAFAQSPNAAAHLAALAEHQQQAALLEILMQQHY
jgi:hypothetical protein